MLATVPAATATTEPAVTFFVKVRGDGLAIVFSARRAGHHRSVAAGRRTSTSSTGQQAVQVDIGGLRTRVLRPGQKRRVSAYVRGSRAGSRSRSWAAPCPGTKAGFASSSQPWPAAPGLPRGGHRRDRRIERRGGDRPARRRAQSLGGAWALPNGEPSGTRSAPRAAITSRTVATLEPAWRFRFRGREAAFGLLTSTPRRRRRDRLRPGREVERLRARSRAPDGCAGRAIYTAPNDGPNGAAVVGDRVVRRDGHDRLRAQRGERAAGVEPAAGRSGRAVRRHRARRRPRPRLRQHRRLRARRPWRDLRARRRARVAMRWKFDTIARAVADRARRRRRRLESRVRRRRRSRLRRDLEPRAVGRLEGAPERRRVPRPRALHRLARRARRRDRRGCSGTTRSSRHDVRDYDFHVTPILARCRRRASWCSARARGDASSRGTGRRAGGSGRARSGRT